MGRPGRIGHYSDTATSSTGKKISIKQGVATFITISNIDGVNGLDVSFDGGTNFFTIPKGGFPLAMPCQLHFFYVRGNGGNVAWCAVTNEG